MEEQLYVLPTSRRPPWSDRLGQPRTDARDVLALAVDVARGAATPGP